MRWWERVGRWDDTRRFGVDAVAAAVTAVFVVPLTMSFVDDPTVGVFALVMCVALAWRRTAPAASAAVVYGTALLHLTLTALFGLWLGSTVDALLLLFPADGLVLVALYSVTVHGPVWAYRTAIAGALVGGLLVGAGFTVLQGAPSGTLAAFMLDITFLATFALALVRRSRRETIDALVDRAQRLEVERDQQARLATAAERARIAREMHDIVAHSLSVIIAQADGGRYVAEADPRAASRSLTTIAETGRAALADMRRLLGVLRPGEQADDDGARPAPPGGAAEGGNAALAADGTPSARRSAPVDLTPQPAVADIQSLVDQVRGSGVRVSLVTMGEPRPLPPGTGLTVYRICQESLTNILKHAGPAPTATVLLQWNAAALVLEVSDDGRGAAAETDGAGQGVLGMRERAAMLGGTVTVGPRPGGGYRVRAEIPIPRVAPREGATVPTASPEQEPTA